MTGSKGPSGQGNLNIRWQSKAWLNESKGKACGQKPGGRDEGYDQG